ncbi:MAG: PAS domain S-box protein [Planctomycetes bacterium]|nr:PAS domain S-box protein [Planctomycetota bacterium]
MATILVVDDDASIRKYVKMLLAEAGHQVLEAGDGAEGLHLVRTEHPDLVISDFAMPTMDGYELARQILADPALARTPMIFVTAVYQEMEVNALMDEPGSVVHLIKKPFASETLLVKVDQVLRSRPLSTSYPIPDGFGREHLRLLTNKLAEKVQDLQASEQRLRAIFEHSQEAILLVDDEARFRDVNPAACALFGYSRSQLLRMRLGDVISEKDKKQVEESWRTLLATGKLAGEATIVRQDATTREVEVRAAANILPGLHLLTKHDVTERKWAVEALRQSEQQMRLFMEATSDAVWNWDLTTGKVARSSRFKMAFGYSDLEVDSTITWWEDRLHPDDRANVFSTFQNTVASGGHACSYDYRFRRKDGTYAVINDRAYIVRDAHGNPLGAIGAMTDVTERKQAEAEREHLFQQVVAARVWSQDLSRRLMQAQEDERRYLSRELHDQIGQALTGLIMTLEGATSEPDALRLGRLIKEALAIASQVLQQVRTLSLDLRPALLDEFGLVDALEWYLDRLAQRAQFTFQFSRGPVKLSLPPEVQVACFRVAQEALTNVARHARARKVYVGLRQNAEEIELVIRDDGDGFDVSAARARARRGGSLGLLGMTERASLLGGWLEIVSAPGGGTTVTARFPLSIMPPQIEGPQGDFR